MSGANPRWVEHHRLVTRAEAGELGAVERKALGVLLDRLLVAVELEGEHGAATAWSRVVDAYRGLVPVPREPPSDGRGADVRPLRAR